MTHPRLHLPRGVLRGRTTDAPWVRPALFALLGLTALLYLVGLNLSGWANSYYSAAVQAGTVSLKALFFGAFDGAGFITVDKTPASLWVMGLSARLFGLSSWSLLVPQALMGVGSVWLTYAAVRRLSGPGAALLSGAVVALTPACALMFRYNNPDALLTLLLVAAAYATLRAVEGGKTRWLLLAGSLIGLGFLTKMLQAFLVVPGFALAYLLAGPPRLGRRVLQLLAAGGALLLAGGWWVLVVELFPAASRPFIGGSTTNSILELALGYNGLGRLTGNETGAVVAPGTTPGRGSWGATGLIRLFAGEMGEHISWLLPAALLSLLVGLWLTRHRRRTDLLRAAFVVWGGWLLVTGLIFSFAGGIIHPYYTVVLAPAIGALIGMGVALLWERRDRLGGRTVLAGLVGVTAVWSFLELGLLPTWLPWLRWTVLGAGLVAVVLLLLSGQVDRIWTRSWPGVVLAAVALVATLGGPAAFSVATAAQPHFGALPSIGPPVPRWFELRDIRLAGDGGPQGPGAPGPDGASRSPRAAPVLGQGRVVGGSGSASSSVPAVPRPFPRGVADPPAEDGPPVDRALVALLRSAGGRHQWAAAMTAACNAAPLQLASGRPILAIGGFNGTDRALTLARFQSLVAQGRIRYYIAGGGFNGSPPQGVAREVAAWVPRGFRATFVGGLAVFDFARPYPQGTRVSDRAPAW